MLCAYDLYDIYAVLINLRFKPDYELNYEIVRKIIFVLSDSENRGLNQVRQALQDIPALDAELYSFAFVNNKYTYIFRMLKEQWIVDMLIACFEELSSACQQKDAKRVFALADALHNLPIHLANNDYRIPKFFWDSELEHYRCNWDKSFLAKFQKKRR